MTGLVRRMWRRYGAVALIGFGLSGQWSILDIRGHTPFIEAALVAFCLTAGGYLLCRSNQDHP